MSLFGFSCGLFRFLVNHNLDYHLVDYVSIELFAAIFWNRRGPTVPKGGGKRRFAYIKMIVPVVNKEPGGVRCHFLL